MPMAARISAAAPKIESSSMLKSSRAVDCTTTSVMGRTRATGNPPLAWRSVSLTDWMYWCGSPCVRTSQTTGPMPALSAVMPSVDLRFGDDHHRARIAVQTAVAYVSGDPDDLARALLKLRADVAADDDLLSDGILFRPPLFCHRLVDDHHARSRAVVAIGEVAAAQRNAKDGEVAGSGAHPARAAGGGIVAMRAAHDVERQTEAAFERQATRGGDGLDAGNRRNALASFERKLRDSSGLLIAIAGERHFHGEHVVGVEARIYVAQRDEGANKQRCPDEQNHRQGDLTDDEQGTRLALAESRAGAVAAFLQRAVQVRTRGANRREDAENNAGEQRNAESEGKDAPIESDSGAVFPHPRQVGRADGEQRTDAGIAEDRTKHATREREQNAFRQELAHDADGTGSHGGADGELPLSSRGAHEQEIRHVGARDQQDEADGSEEYEQR